MYVVWKAVFFVGIILGGSKTLVTDGQNQFFLEDKVVINFDFKHGAKKSGQ